MKDFMSVCCGGGYVLLCSFNIVSRKPSLMRSSQMYSKLVDKCFNDCVDDFTSKSVSSREEGCIMRCWDKNMKGQERIQQRLVFTSRVLDVCFHNWRIDRANTSSSSRFQEHNEAMMASGGIANR